MKKKTAIQIAMIVVLLVGGFLAAAFTFDFFAGKTIPPGMVDAGDREKIVEPDRSVKAEIEQIQQWYEAVGTVRPRTEARIEARVMAQVTDVRVRPGDRVAAGDLLVVLDSRQLDSRLDQAGEALKGAMAGERQARQTVAAADAAYEQARSHFRRIQSYFESEAATEQQLEQARSAFLQADAGLKRAKDGLGGAKAAIEQARQVVREAEIALDYTQLTAPEAGEVLKRLTDPGDLALPGKPLLILQTTGTLRLEAHVREALIGRLSLGDSLPVEIKAIDQRIESTVEEIIPYADPQTRTFLVKVSLQAHAGLYPGMFGKLLIPLRQHPAVLVPKEAIREVGQLDLVTVKTAEQWQDRFVKIGKSVGDRVEVLSGLSGNETLAVGGVE